MFWRLGTMLKRFFEAKSFIFHVPKPIQVPKITFFWYFRHTVEVACNLLKEKRQKALNHDLTLPSYSTRRELPESSGIMDLQNKNISVVKKHWNCRISFPMSDISWLDIREIWKGTLIEVANHSGPQAYRHSGGAEGSWSAQGPNGEPRPPNPGTEDPLGVPPHPWHLPVRLLTSRANLRTITSSRW